MQSQSQPQPSNMKYHPPLAPKIPREVQNLIPRLSIAIQDIDMFKAEVEKGHLDGTLPNWDVLLTRYGLLLARLSSLSSSISQLTPPPPSTRPGAPKPITSEIPILSKYLVHPLNPLPLPNSSSTSTANDNTAASQNTKPPDPIAYDAFFQVLNTQPLDSVTQNSLDLLSNPPLIDPDLASSGENRPWRRGEPWISLDSLKKMPSGEIDGLVARLKNRLDREHTIVEKLRDSIKEHEEEYNWIMRIEEDQVAEGEEETNDENDDLFGDDDDNEGEDKKPTTLSEDEKKGQQRIVAPNPRDGWGIADYIHYMDTGVLPSGSQQQSVLISAPAAASSSNSQSLTTPQVDVKPQPAVIDLTI